MPTNTQQYQYYDNQDTFDPDIDTLYDKVITPIDQIRSHFNGLISGSLQTNTTQYQESRCHAFFRMLGFPVASTSGYYSPGYDPTLNLDYDTQQSVAQIANSLSNNNDFVKSQSYRETKIYQVYNNIFNLSGINATAISIGSMHLRSFATQFTDGVQPLSFDSGQIQNIAARVQDITQFFSRSSATFPATINNITQGLLQSTHIIKPFVVDPRIDNNIKPNANRVAAPFLMDRSQLKIFDGADTPVILKRPYIEFVLSTIFNNASAQQLSNSSYVKGVINSIKASGTTDQDLINTVSNSQLTQTSIFVFAKYLKIIRSLITLLYGSILELEGVRTNINWQPVPNNKQGLEAGASGGSILDVVPGDPNNMRIENDIINVQSKQILDEFSLNVGNNGVPDPGDFAFSGIDDIVFDGKQAAQTSYADILNNLKNRRNQLGVNVGMNALKNIEIIMGEFSGLGLLDIFAIQAAMWVVSPSVLVSMIDQRAFKRMQSRQNLSITASQSSDIISSLTTFEATVKQIYKLIDAYIGTLIKSGQYTDIQPQ